MQQAIVFSKCCSTYNSVQRCRDPPPVTPNGTAKPAKICATGRGLIAVVSTKSAEPYAVAGKANGVHTCANEEKPNRIWSRGALAIGIAFPIIPAILCRSALAATLKSSSWLERKTYDVQLEPTTDEFHSSRFQCQ